MYMEMYFSSCMVLIRIILWKHAARTWTQSSPFNATTTTLRPTLWMSTCPFNINLYLTSPLNQSQTPSIGWITPIHLCCPFQSVKSPIQCMMILLKMPQKCHDICTKINRRREGGHRFGYFLTGLSALEHAGMGSILFTTTWQLISPIQAWPSIFVHVTVHSDRNLRQTVQCKCTDWWTVFGAMTFYRKNPWASGNTTISYEVPLVLGFHESEGQVESQCQNTKWDIVVLSHSHGFLVIYYKYDFWRGAVPIE